MNLARHIRLRSWAGLGLALFLGCSTFGDHPPTEHPKAKIESLFVESDHRLGACCHGDLARSYAADPDSVLFYDRDSRIRVHPPTKKGAVAYHAHLLHRVGGTELLDFVVNQDSSGAIEIDLKRFDQPEGIVITSAARRISEERTTAGDASALLERPDELITPNYVLSFKLVPRDGQIETILALNPHRYEMETEAGTLFLVVSSFSRRDQLLTFIDPKMSLSSLVAEDPYVYLQGEDGAIPPRIMVEVLQPGSKEPWQKAATYHMPEAVDRFTKPSDRPFMFRTSKRDLIAFAPPARVDLVLPKDPPQTSALVKATFTGLEGNEAIKFILACAYPSGPKGDYGVRAQTHVVSATTGTQTSTCDIGHLDPSSFPLVASISHRLVTPWQLTGGRWAPKPPMGKVIVPLMAPKGDVSHFSKLLAPKYASHFDFLTFVGAGSGKRKGSSILDSDLGRTGGPDDPNVTPPPTPPPGGPGGGGGIVPPPGTDQNAGAGQGGGIGGGQDSNCGCGKGGASCLRPTPCKGHCGQACPGNGCCKPGPNQNGGAILIKYPCPPKGKSCGKSEKDCKCNAHQWDRESVRGTLLALLQAMPNFADLDGPNAPIGFAPCHKQTHICDVVAHFWNGGALGIGGNGAPQTPVTYQINVIFKPCVGPGMGGGGGKKEEEEEEVYNGPTSNPTDEGTGLAVNSGSTGGTSLMGGGITINVNDPGIPISTTRNPTIDPNTILDVTQATNALNGGTTTSGAGVAGGLTNSIFADIIRADVQTLLDIRSALDVRATAMSQAWLLRPVNILNGPDSWTMSLPSAAWATYQQGTTTPGGGTTTTTPPPTTPPPPPPTSTKPRT